MHFPKISYQEKCLRNKRVDSFAVPQKYERDTLVFPDLTKHLLSGESFVLYYSIGAFNEKFPNTRLELGFHTLAA